MADQATACPSQRVERGSRWNRTSPSTEDGIVLRSEADPLQTMAQADDNGAVNWTDAGARMEALLAGPRFAGDAALAHNLHELLAVLAGAAPPDSVDEGRDPSVSLTLGNYEVEVFADHLVTYQFHDGDTPIHHWPHEPGSPFDPAFLDEVAHCWVEAAT